MKKIFFLTCVLWGLNVLITNAQTIVLSGSVSGTWTLTDSPYLIQGNIVIPNGSTLNIQPGVTVNFQGTYKLNVQGQLLAIGNSTDTIVFTAANTSTGWKGIRFDNPAITNDTSRIVFCKLQYAVATGAAPEYNGGGLFFNNCSKAVVSNSSILNCKALHGAGIYFNNFNCSPLITYNRISYNTNDMDGGGAIFCENGSSPTISHNIITYNSSIGAGASSGGITCMGGNPIITNNVISYNTSFMNAGGIACHATSARISNNTISYNSASAFGGGVYCGTINYPIFNDNIIANNTAAKGGGFFLTASTNVAISGNIICNNTATADGGGIYCESGSVPPVLNSTITNNNAVNGGGLYCTGVSVPVFRNCILFGNTASTNGAQVFLFDEGSDPDFYYSDVQGGSIAFDVNGNFYSGNYQNNINTNPLFVAPSVGSGQSFNGVTVNWSLQNASSCIDTGDPAGSNSSLDIAGNPRINVCRIDMGAYEYQVGIPFTFSLNITKAIPCHLVAAGEIEATVTSGTGPYTYLWSDGQTTSKATGLAPGNYSVTVSQVSDGCSLTKNITLDQNWTILIMPDAGFDKTIICGGTTQLNVNTNYTGSGTLTFDWAPSTGLSNSTIFNPTSTVTSNTKYIVTVTTPNGCIRNDSVMVIVDSLTVFAGMNKTITCDGNAQLDNVFTNYTGTGNLTYHWSPSKGLNDSTILNPVANVTSSTKYSVAVKTPNGCVSTDTVMVLVNPITLYAGNDKAIICGGTTQLDSVFSDYFGGGILTYNWLPSTGLNYDTVLNPTAEVINNSSYLVTVTTPHGCTATDSVRVFVSPLTVNGNGTSIKCGDTATLNTTNNYTGSGILTYSWLPITGLDSSTISNPTVTVETNKTYTVTVTTPNGCTATHNVNVSLIPMNAIDICIVGVDSTNKNRIVWNKPLSAAIDSFYIYKETNITNVYQMIGSVNYDSLCVFVDVNSHPDVQSNKYKISIKDKCELESNASVPHHTMHLSINQGVGITWNLIWDAYQGFTVSTYNVFRGTAPSNMQLIGTSSGSNSQYSDLTPPSGFVYYQVEVVSPNQCNPTRSYNSSRSNIVTNQNIGIFENSNTLGLISIYPNPASDFFILKTSNVNSTGLILNIYNVIGELIKSEPLVHNQQEINIKDLSSGIYMVEIKSKDLTQKQKLVIER